MTNYKQIILNKGKEFSALRKHPWIFSGAIRQKDNGIVDGTIVEVFSAERRFLGVGHFQDGSISVRLVSNEPTNVDEDFYYTKIKKAFDYRKQIGVSTLPNTNVYRLVFGESDGLPGLIIDYYNNNAVIQCHSI